MCRIATACRYVSDRGRKYAERVCASDIATRIASGAFWSLVGSGFAKLFVLVSGIICAHVLTKEEYGQYGMVRSTVNLFVVFGSAGMGLTAAKYISEFREKQKDKAADVYFFTNAFACATGILVTALILLLAPSIAESLLHHSELTGSLRVGALLLFVSVLNGAQNGALSGFENFAAMARNTLIGSIAESVLMLVGAYYGGVLGATLGFGMGFIALYLCNRYSIRRSFAGIGITTLHYRFRPELLSLLWKFSLPAAVSSLMTAPVYFLVRAMLSRHAGFGDVALYEVAEQWRMIIIFIPTSVAQIVLPILSSLGNANRSQFFTVLRYNILINASVAALLTVIVVLASPWILHLYGSEYAGGEIVIITLVLSTVFSSVATVVGAALQSQAKTWVGLLFNAGWAGMLLLFSSVFLNLGWGAQAIALAFLLSYLIHATGQYLYIRIAQ